MDRIFAPCINGHNMVHLKSSFFSRYATGFTTELSSFQNLTPDGSWNMISIYPPVFPNSITSLFYLFINLRFTDMNKLFFLISIFFFTNNLMVTEHASNHVIGDVLIIFPDLDQIAIVSQQFPYQSQPLCFLAAFLSSLAGRSATYASFQSKRVSIVGNS